MVLNSYCALWCTTSSAIPGDIVCTVYLDKHYYTNKHGAKDKRVLCTVMVLVRWQHYIKYYDFTHTRYHKSAENRKLNKKKLY